MQAERTGSGRAEQVEIQLDKGATDKLLQSGWKYIEKLIPNAMSEHVSLIDRVHNRLLEITSDWDSDSLYSITVKSSGIGGKGTTVKPKFEAELRVINQGAYTMTGEPLEKYQFRGRVNNGWVRQVQTVLDTANRTK